MNKLLKAYLDLNRLDFSTDVLKREFHSLLKEEEYADLFISKTQAENSFTAILNDIFERMMRGEIKKDVTMEFVDSIKFYFDINKINFEGFEYRHIWMTDEKYWQNVLTPQYNLIGLNPDNEEFVLMYKKTDDYIKAYKDINEHLKQMLDDRSYEQTYVPDIDKMVKDNKKTL